MGDHHDHDHSPGYTGPATVIVDGVELAVRVDLRGAFQPIDGRFHWYGRVAADPELARLVQGNRTDAVLRTPAGERVCQLSDPDLWERFRITGEGTPPFVSGLERPA